MAGRNRRENAACDEDHVRRPPFNNEGERGSGRDMNMDSGLAETRFIRRNPIFQDDDAERVGHNATPNRPNRHMRPKSGKFSELQPARWIVGVQRADNPYEQTKDDENEDVDDTAHYVNISVGERLKEGRFVSAESHQYDTENQHSGQMDNQERSARDKFDPSASPPDGNVARGMQNRGLQNNLGIQVGINGQEMHRMQQQFQGQGMHQGFQGSQENQIQPNRQQLQAIQGQQYLPWQQQQQQPWQQQQQLWQQQMQPWQHGHQPHQLQYNDGSSPVYTVQPPTQTMTRGYPDKPSEPSVPELKDPASRFLLVFKRLLSIALVICDTVLDWMEYSDFLPEDVSDAIGVADKIKSLFGKASKAKITYNCNASEKYYLVFTIFGTIFALIQIADIIGETLPDLTTKYKGFRLLHGFNEVLITYAIEEIPQAICLIFFSFKCGCEFDLDINGKGVRKIFTTIFGFLSGYTRQSTCRQVERPSCYFELDFPSFCCFIPLCEDPTQDLKACTCYMYKLPTCDICPDSSSKLSCLSIAGVNDRDRKFARWMTAKLSKLYTLVSIVLIVSVVIKQCL